eukprot:218262_1
MSRLLDYTLDELISMDNSSNRKRPRHKNHEFYNEYNRQPPRKKSRSSHHLDANKRDQTHHHNKYSKGDEKQRHRNYRQNNNSHTIDRNNNYQHNQQKYAKND